MATIYPEVWFPDWFSEQRSLFYPPGLVRSTIPLDYPLAVVIAGFALGEPQLTDAPLCQVDSAPFAQQDFNCASQYPLSQPIAKGAG